MRRWPGRHSSARSSANGQWPGAVPRVPSYALKATTSCDGPGLSWVTLATSAALILQGASQSEDAKAAVSISATAVNERVAQPRTHYM